MSNKRKTFIALFLLILILNSAQTVFAQENKTNNQNVTFLEAQQKSNVENEGIIIEAQRSLDMPLNILNTVANLIGALVGLLTLVIAILGTLGFLEIKKWREIRKNIETEAEDVKKVTAAIKESRNNAEKNVDTLRVDIDKSIPHLLTEEPSSKVKGKLSEFVTKLEHLKVYGGSLKAEDYFYRGYYLFYDKQYDLALKDFEAAIDFEPDYFKAWYFKGATLTYSGYYEKALKVFEKAIEKKSDSAEAWCFKGVTLENLKQADEALEAYEKALGFKPEYAEAWYNKGAVHGSKGEYDEAIKAYENAIKLKPDYPGALYGLARAHSIKGEKEKALDNLKKTTEIVKSYKEKAKEDKDFERFRKYLFSWEEVPGNDSGRLIEFLKQNFGVDWVKTAKIEKIDGGGAITISTEKNYLTLRLNDKKTKVSLKIDDGRTDEFNANTENNKLNIYLWDKDFKKLVE